MFYIYSFTVNLLIQKSAVVILFLTFIIGLSSTTIVSAEETKGAAFTSVYEMQRKKLLHNLEPSSVKENLYWKAY
ncbi:MAG: hypothetical protein KAH20_14585 [Methylococcales bacterium]|nr:hypothetical protein [Methylococcales bacterium]